MGLTQVCHIGYLNKRLMCVTVISAIVYACLGEKQFVLLENRSYV